MSSCFPTGIMLNPSTATAKFMASMMLEQCRGQGFDPYQFHPTHG